MSERKTSKQLRELVLCAILSAIIVVMTVVPYTGYITYGPLEIVTLHIPVILGAVALGWKYGAVLGGVWGITNLLRALTNPLWIMFVNPLVSVLPRILVGLFAGLVFAGLKKTKLPYGISGGIAALVGTLTNTVLVITALFLFGNMLGDYAAFFNMFKTIYTTVIGLNGSIELIAAVIIVPLIYSALKRAKLVE